jgi:hypothetical protein
MTLVTRLSRTHVSCSSGSESPPRVVVIRWPGALMIPCAGRAKEGFFQFPDGYDSPELVNITNRSYPCRRVSQLQSARRWPARRCGLFRQNRTGAPGRSKPYRKTYPCTTSGGAHLQVSIAKLTYADSYKQTLLQAHPARLRHRVTAPMMPRRSRLSRATCETISLENGYASLNLGDNRSKEARASASLCSTCGLP